MHGASLDVFVGRYAEVQGFDVLVALATESGEVGVGSHFGLASLEDQQGFYLGLLAITVVCKIFMNL
jgi:hypothetical protein